MIKAAQLWRIKSKFSVAAGGYEENPSLWGGQAIRFTGLNAQGDHPVLFEGVPDVGLEFTTTEHEQALFSFSVGAADYYHESILLAPIPPRVSAVTALFPPASVANQAKSIKVYADIPLESRGGRPFVECSLNGQRIASLATGQGMTVLRPGDDPAFEALSLAFVNGGSIPIRVSGFEAFDTWTEPRPLSEGTIGLEAWLDS